MHKQLLSDQDLVQLYLNGHEAAFERLVMRHKDRVYTAIFMLVKDQCLAEDIFQETFIKAIDRLRAGKYQDEGKLLPWLLRISHNLCIDYFRKVKRSPSMIISENNDVFKTLQFDETPVDTHLDVVQSESRLKEIIEKLPPEQKEVVMLRHYFDFSFKEISEYTNVSINTSLGRMRYALINLRKMLEDSKVEFIRA